MADPDTPSLANALRASLEAAKSRREADPDTAATAAAVTVASRKGGGKFITTANGDQIALSAAEWDLIVAEARETERQLRQRLKRLALSWASSGEPAALECARQLADLLDGATDDNG